jgi:hypothetical protein
MSETVQQLTRQQIATLRRQFRDRDAAGLGAVLRSEPVPPLPGCLACGVEPERVDQWVDDLEFGVDGAAVRLRWLPCGHRFRAVVDLEVVDLDAGPVRPGEEPTT